MTAPTRDLPAFPQVAFDALNLFFDREPNTRMVVRSLSRCPGVVARVLAVANSPAFGAEHPTADLLTAAGRLGLDNLRQILMEEAMESAFPFHNVRGFDGKALWHHSALTGQIAYRLAKIRVPHAVSDVHIAGLLHDAGLFHLGIAHPEKALSLSRELAAGKPISLAERELQIVSHGQLGFELAQGWRLPESVSRIILWHESPSSTVRPPEYSSELNHLIDVVHLADLLAQGAADAIEAPEAMHIDAGLLTRVGLSSLDLLLSLRAARQYLDGAG